jgi:Na+/proline symporter
MSVVAISFAVCTLLTILAGVVAVHGRKQDAGEYLLSNRTLGTLVTSLSVSGTDVTGWIFMGLVGAAYTGGLSVIWVLPAGMIGYFLLWALVARPLRKNAEATGAHTFPEFLSAGFPSLSARLIRGCAALVILVFLTMYLSGQFNASGKALYSFFQLPYEWGVLAGIPLMLPYIVVAGMRGVGWSEFAQAILIAIGVVLVPLIAFAHTGGFSPLIHGLQAADPALVSVTGKKVGFDAVMLVVFWLSIGLCYPGQPQILTRFMAAKDDETLVRGRWISFGWFLLVAAMSVLLGLCARVSFSDVTAISSDPEQTLPVLANRFLPPALVGLVLAAIMCAIMNSSMVFVILTALIADTMALFGKRPDRYGLVFRSSAGLLVVGGAATLALLGERSIFKVVLDAWAVLGATFGPVVFYRLWTRQPRSSALLAGMASGCVAAVLLNGHDESQMVLSVAAAALAVVLVHFAAGFLLPRHVTVTDTPKPVQEPLDACAP